MDDTYLGRKIQIFAQKKLHYHQPDLPTSNEQAEQNSAKIKLSAARRAQKWVRKRSTSPDCDVRDTASRTTGRKVKVDLHQNIFKNSTAMIAVDSS
nr:unnamed protein product [Callosobruchus chinensis]